MAGNLFSDAFNSPMEGAISPEGRQAAERLLQQQFKLVKGLIEDNKPHVHAIVEALLEKEELLGEEVEAIVARVDREVGHTNGHVAELTAPTEEAIPLQAPDPVPILRYAGATRRTQEREAPAAPHKPDAADQEPPPISL